ncbi:MAG: phosphatidylglycerophosphatase A [Acidimicrobiia bacterium]|nr:phosphatidylglycerophosphatase A [Acidimicrobiia bacterium]
MHRLIASWFGSGLLLGRIRGSDTGSGTIGAAITLPLAWWLNTFGWWACALGALVVTGLSVWSARPFAAEGGDPGWIVVDEAAGTLVASIGLGGGALFLAWVVFRLADATKRFPGVAAAERLPGAVGITVDDLVAGAWALAAGWVFTLLA